MSYIISIWKAQAKRGIVTANSIWPYAAYILRPYLLRAKNRSIQNIKKLDRLVDNALKQYSTRSHILTNISGSDDGQYNEKWRDLILRKKFELQRQYDDQEN